MTVNLIEFTQNRLMIDPWEFRPLSASHVVHVGRLGRAIHAGLVPKTAIVLHPSDVIRKALEVPYYDVMPHCSELSPITVAKPGLMYQRTDGGELVLLDGIQRAFKALAIGQSKMTVWVISEADLASFGLLDSDGLERVQRLADLDLKPGKVLTENLRRPIRDRNSPNVPNISIVGRANLITNFHYAQGRTGYNDASKTLEQTYILNAIELLVAERVSRTRRKDAGSKRRHTEAKWNTQTEKVFLDGLTFKDKPIPKPFSYRRFCDKANDVVRAHTPFEKRHDYEYVLAKAFGTLPLETLNEHLDNLKTLHGQLCRALYRSLSHTMGQHRLYQIETTDKIPLSEIVAAAAGTPAQQEMWHLSTEDKFDVAIAAGVNPANFYIEDTYFGPLLSWAAMVPYFIKKNMRVFSLYMAENYLYRRSIALAGESDHLSELWDRLLDSFSQTPLSHLASSISMKPASDASLLDYLDWLCIEMLKDADARGN